MQNTDKIVDKQVGRNSDLFAQAIAEIQTKQERYQYLRILVSVIEQAHPEWNQAPTKDRQVANLVFRMSKGQIDVDEVSEIVQLRDAERGYGPVPEREEEKKQETKTEEARGGDPSQEAEEGPSSGQTRTGEEG